MDLGENLLELANEAADIVDEVIEVNGADGNGQQDQIRRPEGNIKQVKIRQNKTKP